MTFEAKYTEVFDMYNFEAESVNRINDPSINQSIECIYKVPNHNIVTSRHFTYRAGLHKTLLRII